VTNVGGCRLQYPHRSTASGLHAWFRSCWAGATRDRDRARDRQALPDRPAASVPAYLASRLLPPGLPPGLCPVCQQTAPPAVAKALQPVRIGPTAPLAPAAKPRLGHGAMALTNNLV
jgi:hypothetical protein